jgi:hypothetical protein
VIQHEFVWIVLLDDYHLILGYATNCIRHPWQLAGPLGSLTEWQVPSAKIKAIFFLRIFSFLKVLIRDIEWVLLLGSSTCSIACSHLSRSHVVWTVKWARSWSSPSLLRGLLCSHQHLHWTDHCQTEEGRTFCVVPFLSAWILGRIQRGGPF